MKINEIITKELLERYRYKHRPVARKYVAPKIAPRRPASAHRKQATSPKNVAKPAPKMAPVINRQSMAPTNQTTGLNPKIDLTKGNNFQLNNHNIRPELTDKEIEMAMQSRNNDKRSF